MLISFYAVVISLYGVIITLYVVVKLLYGVIKSLYRKSYTHVYLELVIKLFEFMTWLYKDIKSFYK